MRSKMFTIAVFTLVLLLSVGSLTAEEKMENIRNSILAGSWYPSDANALRNMIEDYISQAVVDVPPNRAMGIVAPHAGYVFSGPVAGYSFKLMREQAKVHDINTVIVLAFSHQGDGDGRVSVWSKGGWRTPLGVIQVNEELAEQIINVSPRINFNPQTHSREHSLEIMLPFIQVAIGNDVNIVPISFSRSSVQEIEELVNALSVVLDGNKDAMLLISTDFSHYHSYDKAIKMDRRAIEFIIDNDIDGLMNALSTRDVEMCGTGPVITSMELARRFGAEDIQLLQYANSGDVPEGEMDRVVGYAAMAMYFNDGVDGFRLRQESSAGQGDTDGEFTLTRDQKIYLLRLAREAMDEYVKTGRVVEPEKPKDKKLTEKGAVFVTLEIDGNLRGCIGQMVAQGPLYLAVRDMAIAAAVNDNRFRPVGVDELRLIDIEISVLSPMGRIDSYKDVRLGIDGVYLVGQRGGMMRTGVFLPSVAVDTGWSLDQFLGELCSQKAGLPRDCYKDPDIELYTYTVLKFTESELMLD